MGGTEAVATVALLAGSLCMPLLLATLTWVSWRVLRTRSVAEKDALRALTGRLTAALWAVAVALVATAIVLESHSAAAGLPSLWHPAVTASDYGRALVLLPLGAYLLLAQTVVSLTALTWRLPMFQRRGSAEAPARVSRNANFAGRRRTSDLGTALVSTAGLVASVLASAVIALVAVLRLSAQGVLA
jgi:hypothetical protein